MPDYRRHYAENLLQLLQGGVKQGMDAMDSVLERKAAAERQKAAELAASGRQKAELEGRLANEKAMADYGVQTAAQKRAQAQADNQKLLGELQGKLNKGGKRYSINLNDDGGISVAEQENLGAMNAQIARGERAQKEKDQALVKYGERIEKEGLPEIYSQLDKANKALPKAGEDFKSAGPWANAIPNFLVPAAESVGVLDKGATEERAALSALKALLGHKTYGASLSTGESRDREAWLGLPLGQSTEGTRDTIDRMNAIPRQSFQNIEQSTRPDVVSEYQGRGGIKASDLKTLVGAQAPQGGEGMANAAGKTLVKQQRNKVTGKIRNVYSDGSTEDVN
jgi:hypothetical protein